MFRGSESRDFGEIAATKSADREKVFRLFRGKRVESFSITLAVVNARRRQG